MQDGASALPTAGSERTNSYLWLAWFINVNLHTAEEPGSVAEAEGRDKKKKKKRHEKDKRAKQNKAVCVSAVNKAAI